MFKHGQEPAEHKHVEGLNGPVNRKYPMSSTSLGENAQSR